MANLNKVMLIGNLTRDPVPKTVGSGLQVSELRIAINRRYKTSQGEERNEVCYTDVTYMGRLADVCNHYLHKGDPIFVEGHLKFESWIGQDDQKNHSRLSVYGESMQFLSRADRRGQASWGEQPPARGNAPENREYSTHEPPAAMPPFPDPGHPAADPAGAAGIDESIPF